MSKVSLLYCEHTAEHLIWLCHIHYKSAILINIFVSTVPSPSALRLAPSTSFGTAREVVAIKDYSPSSFTTLKFSKGDHLYVLDTSGGEWWYAHNNREMGYIPSTYVQPINYRNSSLSDSGMIDNLGDCSEEGAKELDLLGEWTGVSLKPSLPYDNNNPFSMLSSTNPFLNGSMDDVLDQNSNEKVNQCNSMDLLFFDLPSAPISTTSNTKGYSNSVFDGTSTSTDFEALQMLRKDNPFFEARDLTVYQSYLFYNLSQILHCLHQGFLQGLKLPHRSNFRTERTLGQHG